MPVILTRHTSPENLRMYCPNHLRTYIDRLIAQGSEVHIHKGKVLKIKWSKPFQSNAKWPPGTLNGHDNDISSDRHDTEEEAQGVCTMLERDGFGGEGKIFPVQTWVCSKVTKE